MTSNNVINLLGQKIKAVEDTRADEPITDILHSGGSGGDNSGMKTRVKALETALSIVGDRLTRIETRLEFIPTKADLSNAIGTQTKWVVGLGFTLMLVGIALAKFF
jgi:hypothetical protein